ncbi:hypothetical protein [Roseisolibacter sp. H3M3-2]|uniref:hypothetical protein n=1 Tax=Roseisolibacter sp. H3M3-2 TaxID=3031323 RepID=UPI0023DB69C5|nr:hypothetical protein [Roseisolibacter sp. H3M3-2]MDF1503363.1 hypothetical protein [Roseisolibacter sp. H3M3-2]
MSTTLRLRPTASPAEPPPERRRGGWRDFRRAYAGFVRTAAAALAVLLAMDALLLWERRRYRAEAERLRASMSAVERERTDAILGADEDRLRLTMELLRRRATGDGALHLAVAVDEGRLLLEREGARLRDMRVEVGASRRVGAPPDTMHVAAPRGARTVARVLGPDDAWEVPRWVYEDRGLPVPAARADRTVKGALGARAVLLSGGAVLYTLPVAGPLNEPSYVMPGAVRARLEDLEAIAANLVPGMTVYLY